MGKDHNSDGDINDDVAYMLDMPAPRGGMFNLGFAVRTLALNGSEALIGVPENGHFNGDMNGNGIVGDVVTFYVDFSDTPPTTRGLGLVANATIQVTNPTGGACKPGGGMNCLNITVGVGGQVKMCDPTVVTAGDSRGC